MLGAKPYLSVVVDGALLVVFETAPRLVLSLIVRRGVPEAQGIQERLPAVLRQVSDLSPDAPTSEFAQRREEDS